MIAAGFFAGDLVCAQTITAQAAKYYTVKDTWQDTLIAWHMAYSARKEAARAPVPLPDFGRSQFTVMAWIRTDRDGTIIAKCPPTGEWAPQGKTFFIRGGRLAMDIGWVAALAGRRRVADNKWHHVALTGKDNEFTFYVDGAEDGGGELAAEADVGGHVLKIGYTNHDFPSPSGFKGALDEVRIYNKKLTGEQIRACCEDPKESLNNALVGYWPFDEDGSDASGSNNHLTQMTGAEIADGKTGNALHLNGKGQVILPSSGRTDLSGAAWGLLKKDFADSVSLRQMAWELGDGIWERKWEAGDWADLAGRYVEAIEGPAETVEKAAQLAARIRKSSDLAAVSNLYYQSKLHGEIQAVLKEISLAGLRKTLQTDYDPDTQAKRIQKFLTRIEALEQAASQWRTRLIHTSALDKFKANLRQLQREILTGSDPFAGFDKIVFVKRYTYQSSHYYTDFIDGCEKFGGNVCTLDLNTGEVVEIVGSMKHGIFGRYDLSFDGKRIVFAWKEKIGVGFRIYQVNVDGTGLKQITFDPPDEQQRIDRYWKRSLGSWAGRPVQYRHHTDDMDPCFLPDGGICFISTRCEFGILCDGPDYFTTTVLYRMDGDGKNITKLSNSSVSESYPSVMTDGRILYTRWEYVDKGAVSTKCLWAMYPDGTTSVEIYGNDIAIPSAFIQGRSIPGMFNQYLVLGGPHCCPTNGVGTVIRLDLRRNSRTEEPMTHITPNVRMTASGHNGFRQLRNGKWVQDTKGPLYIDPFPLSDKIFLVSHNVDREWREFDAWDLYVLDETGAAFLIHDDAEISCYQPMPLRARPMPPVLKSSRDEATAKQDLATVIVTDVYHGLEGIERGEVKYIRVNEQAPRPWASRRNWDGDEYDQQHACITKNTHLGLKIQHGIVPVYEDGSAYFVVPARKNIFFQVLDANFMELQRERTFVNYMPGETRSCVGCHERNIDAPPQSKKMPMALLHPAHRPGPQPGERTGQRPIHYIADVQPILDAHCIKCHSGDKPKAKLDLTGAMTTHFSRSYENILARRLIPVIGENHPKAGNIHYLPAKSLGSHASKLIAHLKKGHQDIKLTQAEWVRLTTWVDSNGQFYGSYYGRRNLRYKDHPNFRPEPTFAQAISTRAPLKEDDR